MLKMLTKIRTFICEKATQYKAKYNWHSWDIYNYKDMFPERYNNQIKAANELFIPAVNKNSYVADLGSGDGWFTFVIAPHVQFIDAVDLSKKFTKIAKKNQKENGVVNINFKCIEAEKFLLKASKNKKKYDAVMCMGMFTYITDDFLFFKLLHKIHQILMVNGLFFLKDTLSHEEDILWNDGNYVAKYRKGSSYTKAISDTGFKLMHEGYLSNHPETHTFSGFKIFQKI